MHGYMQPRGALLLTSVTAAPGRLTAPVSSSCFIHFTVRDPDHDGDMGEDDGMLPSVDDLEVAAAAAHAALLDATFLSQVDSHLARTTLVHP